MFHVSVADSQNSLAALVRQYVKARRNVAQRRVNFRVFLLQLLVFADFVLTIENQREVCFADVNGNSGLKRDRLRRFRGIGRVFGLVFHNAARLRDGLTRVNDFLKILFRANYTFFIHVNL